MSNKKMVEQVVNGESYEITDKAARKDILDIKSNYVYDILPRTVDISFYTGAVSPAAFLVSDQYFEAGTMLKAVQFYAFAASPSFHFYLINEDDIVIYHVVVAAKQGWNYIPLMFTLEEKATFGVYGQTFQSYSAYASSAIIKPEQAFSTGYIEGDIKPAQIGDTLTLNQYSTDIIVAFPISIIHKATGDFQAEEKIILDIKEKHITEPKVIGVATLYTRDISLSSFLISDRIIPAGSFIKTVKMYFYSGSSNVYIYIIDSSSHVVKHRIRTTANNTGWLEVPVNYYASAPVVIGVYGHALKAKNNVSADYAFSTGFIEGDIKPAQIGDTLTFTQYESTSKKAVPIQWDYEASDANHINGQSASRYYNEIMHLSNHGCIASFIDDDSGVYVPEIWGEILAETNIRMGFACVAGMISGAVTPGKEEYIQMTVEELKALYNNGHEVYSHSWSHPAFYEADAATISEECLRSKDWLLSQGFFRGTDIIVYPGGLGYAKLTLHDVVKRFYKYGVEATGGAINSDNQIIYKPYSISRINADTSTLNELTAEVDKAYTENKLLVFMNHAYELKKDKSAQVQKMIDLIEYVKTKAIILPLGEALNQMLYY